MISKVTETDGRFSQADVGKIEGVEQGYRGSVVLKDIKETKVPGNFVDLPPPQQQVRVEEEVGFARRKGDLTVVALNPFPYGTDSQVTVYPRCGSLEDHQQPQLDKLGIFLERQNGIAREMFDRISAGVGYLRQRKEQGIVIAGFNKMSTRSVAQLVHAQVFQLPPPEKVYPVAELLDDVFAKQHGNDPHMNGDMYGLVRKNEIGRLMAVEVANGFVEGSQCSGSLDDLDLNGLQIYEGNIRIPLIRPVDVVLRDGGIPLVAAVNGIIDNAFLSARVSDDQRCAGIFFAYDNLKNGDRSEPDNGMMGCGMAVKIGKPNCGIVEFMVRKDRGRAVVRGLERVDPLCRKIPGIDEQYNQKARELAKAMVLGM